MVAPRQRPPGLLAGDHIPRRWLAGEAQASHTRVYSGRGRSRWKAGSAAHLGVVAVGAGVAGRVAGDEVCGGSVVWLTRATAAGRKRAREEGEQTQNLTVEATGWSAGSGTSRRRRTGADDLGRPTTKMTAMAAPRGTPACVARRGGSWRRGGAPGDDGEARERRWLR